MNSLCIEPGSSPHSFSTNSEPLAYVRETLAKKAAIVETGGIRGERSRNVNQTQQGLVEVGGSIWLQPSPVDFDRLLPRILGAAETDDTFDLAETLPTFGVLIDRQSETFAYSDCLVDQAVLRGKKGSPLELEIAIRGVSETTGVAFPTLSVGSTIAEAPYMFHEGVLTLGSQQVEMSEFELTISNHLHVRYVHSITATSITPRDREVTFKAGLPFTTSVATNLYDLPAAGVAGSLALSREGLSTTFSFPALQSLVKSPTTKAKQETMFTLEMVARKSGSSNEISVTNDGAV